MKAEIAVLSGKEPFGVRLELSVKEAAIIARALSDDNNPQAPKMSEALLNLIINVKNLNQQQKTNLERNQS